MVGLLYLSSPVEFEPVSQVSSVFYDEQRGQVLSVRGGGVTGVVVKSLEDSQDSVLTVRLQATTMDPIISIKLSPSLATLSLQRSRHTVSFLPVSSLATDIQPEYSQTARAKNSALLGFVWLSNSELLYITDCGLEVFTICQERRTVKYSRSAGESLAWYSVSGYHVVTSGLAETDTLTVWSLRGGSIVRVASLSLPLTVTDKEVRLLSVYLNVYISVTVDTQIQLYIINNDTASLSHVLTEVDTGTIGLQTLDNIILVHSLTMSRSKLYDIMVSSDDDEGAGGEPLTVSPVLPTTSITSDGSPVSYSPNWVLFLPNVLVDARNGKMMSINMKLSSSNLANVSDTISTAKFLTNREDGKTPLINLLKKCVARRAPLSSLHEMLSCVVTAYTSHQLHLSSDPSASCTVRRSVGPSVLDFPPAVVLDQPDIFTNVLNTFTDSSNSLPKRFLLAAVVEYILCLLEHSLSPRHFLQELLINLCVQTGRLYQLQQYLQYKVITDSKPLACLLLSLESLHAPSRQMALDMMSRLGNASNEITEILLDNGNIVIALNFVTANGGGDSVAARKFLEAAERTGDKMTFYNVFSFLQERNIRLKGSPAFSPKDQCETFVNKFKEMFLLSESTSS